MKEFATRTKSTFLKAFMAFAIVSGMLATAYASNVTNDSCGISGSNTSFVSNVTRGNTIYIHFVLQTDSTDAIANITTLSSTPNNTIFSGDDHVIIHSWNSNPPTGAGQQSTTVPFTVVNENSYDSFTHYLDGTCVLPSNLSASRQSFSIWAYFHWQDQDFNDRMDSVQVKTDQVATSPVGIYQGKYLTCLNASYPPVLITPASYWQDGRNNNTVRVDFYDSTAAPANNDTLSFLSGSTVVQRIVFTNAITASTFYGGLLTYSPAANSGNGGFTSVAADADTSGATSFTFTEPALGTRTGFTNGSTYTVKLAHCESGASSATVSFSSFIYDNAAVALTLGYPIASFQGGHDDDTIRFRVTLPEKAKDSTVTIQFRNGGSTVQQIILANRVGDFTNHNISGRLAYDVTDNTTPFSVVPGSQLNGDTLAIIKSQTPTSDLIDGTTYTVRVFYTDEAGNVSANTDFNSFVYDINTNPPTLTSPVANANLSLVNTAFQWNNTEQYTTDTLFIERLSGTLDANSPHYLAITANDPLLNASNPKTVTIDLANIASTASYSAGPSNHLTLVAGTTYKWYFKSIDIVPTNALVTSSNNQFMIASGNVLNVSATGIRTHINPNRNNSPILRLTCNTVTGTVDLTQLVINFAGNTSPAEITDVSLWYSPNTTLSQGGATHLAGTSYDGNSSTFTGWSLGNAHFNSGIDYLFVTISTSASAQNGHNLTASITNSGKFTFANAGDAVSATFPMSTGSVGLPVQLNRFSANSRNAIAYLDWTTEAEFNNAGFNVQRRLYGEGDFQPVATYTQNPDLLSRADNGTSATPNNYEFVDNTVSPGTRYEYKLSSTDLDGVEQDLTMSVDLTIAELPHEYALENAYPNPFNSSTNVRFDVPMTSNIKVAIYDVNGREVVRLVDGQVDAGTHVAQWNGHSSTGVRVASGAYFVRLTSGKFNTTRKIVLLQ